MGIFLFVANNCASVNQFLFVRLYMPSYYQMLPCFASWDKEIYVHEYICFTVRNDNKKDWYGFFFLFTKKFVDFLLMNY